MPSMLWIGSGKPRHTTVWFLTTQIASFEYVELRVMDPPGLRQSHQSPVRSLLTERFQKFTEDQPQHTVGFHFDHGSKPLNQSAG